MAKTLTRNNYVYQNFLNMNYSPNTKVNIFKENFKLNIYFISIGKQNLNSELCLEDIIYEVAFVIRLVLKIILKINRTS